MTIYGIRCRFHPLFVIIVLGSVLTGFFLELLVLFGIVIIHELGHIAAASSFGWRIREVQLLPFGGVAVVDQYGVVPAREEMIVALAGPLQNGLMIIAALLLESIGVWEAQWTTYFVQANMMIGLFNLLPVLPLDGGKVLHALFSMLMPYYRSLLLSYWISLCMSVFMIGFAVLRTEGLQLNLLMIGFFLLYMNWVGLRHLPYQFLRFLMNREINIERLLKQGVLAEPIIVRSDMQLQQMLRLLMRERHHLYYITNHRGRTRAVVPEAGLIRTFFAKKMHINDAKPSIFM